MATLYGASSRYRLDDGGMTASRLPRQALRYTTHVVQAGETIETIAHSLLGSHARWWEVADLNPQLRSPLSLKPGSVIRIPA